MIELTGTPDSAPGAPDPHQLDLFREGPLPSPHPKEAARSTFESPDPSAMVLTRIGHDLRTALNAIMGFSEIMTQKLHGPLGHPKYEEYVNHVRFSGEALLAVSHEVLMIAGRTSPLSVDLLPRRAAAAPRLAA